MARSDQQIFHYVSTAAAVLAGIALRKALTAGFEGVTGHLPPENPAAREVSWGDALLWSALAGAAVGIARTVAQRGAAAGWERFAHTDAPVVH